MTTPANSLTITYRTLSWICFAMLAVLVAFWVVYFPIERAQLRPLADKADYRIPASSDFFLGGAWWRVPIIAVLIGMLSLTMQLLVRNKLFSMATHLAASFLCVVGIVVYRQGLFDWFVLLLQNT